MKQGIIFILLLGLGFSQTELTKEEKIKVLDYFKNTTISHSLVVDYLESLRQ